MRVTIKSLQEQIDRANEDKNRYYKLWKELESEKSDKIRNQMYENEIFERYDRSECRNLTEIIQALINPDILLEMYKSRFNTNTKNYD